MYPSVLVNPLRPQTQFTLQSGGDLYLTPDGNYIAYEPLRTYVLTGTGQPSADAVKKAQVALGITPVDGQLTEDTMAGVVNLQLQFAMAPTGVPTDELLAKIAGVIGKSSVPKKKPEDWTPLIIGAGILFAALLMTRD